MSTQLDAKKTTEQTGVNDARIPMPSSVREEVIDLLAKILVADYQLFHGAPRPTDGAFSQQRGQP